MTPQQIANLERTIQTYIGRAKFAGLGVGIIEKNKLVYAKGFGEANIEKQIPVTPDTVFRIASTSKIPAAVALMQFHENGRFQLDDPANDHLQSYKLGQRAPHDPPVTIKHLLTHTSGLGETAPLLSYLNPFASFGFGRPGRPLPSLHQFYGNRLTPDSPPGTKWSYANHGFATVGQLVADMSQEPLRTYSAFANHMRKTIFEPLGMLKSDYLRRTVVQQDLATGYTLKNGQNQPAWPDIDIITQADGSLFTTVNDFGIFVTSLLNGRIVSPETLELMWHPHFQLDDRLPAMGLGFFREDWDGRDGNSHRIVGHDGAFIGFRSSMWLAPDDQYGVFAFTNTGSNTVISLVKNLLRDLLDVNAPQQNLPDLEDVEDHQALWPELSGEYEPAPGWNSNLRNWQSYGSRLTVYTKSNSLRVKSGRPWTLWKTALAKGYKLAPLDPENPLAFHLNGSPYIFERNADGKIDKLHFRYNTFYKTK